VIAVLEQISGWHGQKYRVQLSYHIIQPSLFYAGREEGERRIKPTKPGKSEPFKYLPSNC
jgi:hypothetical protein